jgi:hypothetical protein
VPFLGKAKLMVTIGISVIGLRSLYINASSRKYRLFCLSFQMNDDLSIISHMTIIGTRVLEESLLDRTILPDVSHETVRVVLTSLGRE